MRTRPFNVPRRPSVFLSVAALIRMAHHNTVRTCHCQHAGSRYSNDPLIHAVFHRVLSAFPPILDLMVCIPHCRLWNARVHNVAFGDYMWCTNMQQPIRSGPESFKPMISRERPSSSVPLPLCLSWTGSRSIVSMVFLATPGPVLAGVKIIFPFLHSTWHNLLFHIARWTVLHELITI
ncbi:hypothetical protein BKA82DRAFT_606135 [Pisolithus tinctorius]|uniref:Uncharacterized protein n=1 Tax=Pisolithus tinctorius Marx 270 TaxID=870435 RepID=A0A0C3NSE5_PISTI|nr:hypothetical protein BKA82DRAFT_606135 [Pisolithus tinctorius]KIO03760.1 hypothetical protein M404DRAFT_606135 [Pisolithus tinctorius Marx 270]